ncbi:MAG: SLC13 family permease [Flavobacteriales bacterium]|nr:SLC13 family permease [Flavobacteriales bacterium]|tara:strand:- start:28519 stop:30288 length:1770 start_codon:yes stop_codon:yes gene_type:complete
MLTPSVILILISIVFLLSALYLEWFRPTVVFFIAILFLVIGGVLTPSEALHGFGNEQLAVIILLLIISDIFRKSSVIDVLFNKLFGKSNSLSRFRFSMMLLVASFSAFFNNTPLVAMMMPYVNRWSNQKKVSASKLLIPLSYAAILGGCVTLIGTSTNLIVNGMAVDNGFEPLGIFDFTAVGLPMLILGVLYLSLFGNKLLPSKSTDAEKLYKQSREFFIETMVKSNSPLLGKTVENAGLRNLKGLYLVELIRDEHSITPVSPDEILQEEDTLIFAGETTAVEEISKSDLGLTLPKTVERMIDKKSSINEIVVSFNSSLIGKKVMDTDFRARFDAAIVAVHRNGEKLSGKIGEIELRAGDVLLVFSGSDFLSRTKNNQAFYILTHIEEPEDINVTKVSLVFLSLLASIIISATTTIPLIIGLSVVLMLAIFMKIVPLNEIRKGMDFELIMLIAFGLAFGKAMINSGASLYIADLFMLLNNYVGSIGFLMIMFIVTNILAAYITNKAAVAILFPISIALAADLGFNPIPFILIVSFGAAANFITPIGYQTNLMVYGPGGYSFKDFMKVGMPLTILYMIVSALILNYIYLN